MPRGQHGKDSKYFHIRLADPKTLKNMRTVDRGAVKQVVGISRKTKKSVDQNVLVLKRHAKQSGNKLIIKSKKVRESFKKKKIPLSRIFRRKDGGDADYKIKREK